MWPRFPRSHPAVQYGNSVKVNSVYMSQYQLIPYNRIEDHFLEQLRIPVNGGGSIYNFNQEAYDRLEHFDQWVRIQLAIIGCSMSMKPASISAANDAAYRRINAVDLFLPSCETRDRGDGCNGDTAGVSRHPSVTIIGNPTLSTAHSMPCATLTISGGTGRRL